MSGDIVTIAELRARGWKNHHVSAAVSAGKIHRVFRGLYVTAPPEGELLLRAVITAYPHAIFAGDTAAQLYLDREVTTPVHLVVGASDTLPPTGTLVVARRSRRRGATQAGGFPVVDVLDAAEHAGINLGLTLLERHYRGKDGEAALERDLAERASISAALRKVLGVASVGADSELERTLFRRLRARGHKVHQNYVVAGYRFDGLVAGHILIEVDCYTHHSANVLPGRHETWDTFIRDRWKANIAQRLGYLVLRYSDADIEFHPETVLAQIEDTIARCPSRRKDAVPDLLDQEREMVWKWHGGILQYIRHFDPDRSETLS